MSQEIESDDFFTFLFLFFLLSPCPVLNSANNFRRYWCTHRHEWMDQWPTAPNWKINDWLCSSIGSDRQRRRNLDLAHSSWPAERRCLWTVSLVPLSTVPPDSGSFISMSNCLLGSLLFTLPSSVYHCTCTMSSWRQRPHPPTYSTTLRLTAVRHTNATSLRYSTTSGSFSPLSLLYGNENLFIY